jgi:hypothetical protein
MTDCQNINYGQLEQTVFYCKGRFKTSLEPNLSHHSVLICVKGYNGQLCRTPYSDQGVFHKRKFLYRYHAGPYRLLEK